MYKFNDNGHTTVIGKTQEGKTYAVNHILKNQKNGVIFFNTQLEELKNYIKIDKNTSFKVINDLLKKGQKLNYEPSSRLSIQSQEITFLINQIFENCNFSKSNYIYFVVDEVHLFKKVALESICRIATGGIRYGVHGIFLSQRPANIDNTLMTQSIEMIIFKCNMESQYFKNYCIPIDEILLKIEQNGRYSFCSYNFSEYMAYNKI